jgi:hypothetical protein
VSLQRDDRDEVLGRVDLAELLRELGDARGLEPRGHAFPCPSIEHEQTGRTPPVTIDTAPPGYGLWNCHACGRGGTAIDALLGAGVAHDVADAFAQLRGDLPARSAAARPAVPSRAPVPVSPAQLAAARVELSRYVRASHVRLRASRGARTLAWLHARGLTDPEIDEHRLGHDPGYKLLQRPRYQLPAPARSAAVLPLLDVSGHVIYAQARPLTRQPGSPKYFNPHRDWIGPSPWIGAIVSRAGADHSVLVVTEGICDGIVAGRHYAAKALIGAGQPDQPVAERLSVAAGERPVVVCLDPDPDGRAGAERLLGLLAEHTSSCAAAVALPAGDVNQLFLDAPDEFVDTFRALVDAAAARARADRAQRSNPEGGC